MSVPAGVPTTLGEALEPRLPQPTTQDLDRSLVRGIAWTGAMRWATQLLSWASTLIVARLLAPSDYGLVGMAMVYLGFMQLVNEFGLGAAIVTRRDLTEDQIARLSGLALLLGCGFVALSAAVSAPIAGFFGEPTVRWIIMALSLTFVSSALQIVPRALLVKELDFRKLAWVDGVDALAGTCSTLLFAVLGLRYWALILGALVGRTTSTFLLHAWRPHRMAWPREFPSLSEAVTFGWQLMVSRIAWYVYSNADFAIVGRVLGKTALGAYTLGWEISSIPIERVSALVGSVTPPVFSAVQHDRPALQRYLRNLTEGIALITFPASIGLGLVADEFVQLVLGEHWRPAIVPLRLLALSTALRSVSPLLPQIIVSTDHTRRNLQFNVIATLVLPSLFYIGTHWGTAGVAAAWLVGHPTLVMPWFLVYVLRLTGLPLAAYLRSLLPAAGATLMMAATVLGVRVASPGSWPGAIRLATQVLAGVAAYGGVLWYAHRPRLRALWRQFRDIRS